MANIIEIAADGDVVLQVEHEVSPTRAVQSFRVSSSALKTQSKYFERLFQSDRFHESAIVQTKHRQLQEIYGDSSAAPSADLPILEIKDVGRIFVLKAVDALMTDFLHVLHGKDTPPLPPVANLANLAIVADRFDALDVVKSYVKRKKMVRALDGKTTPKADAGLGEEKVRQRLLIAILFDYAPWLEKYSARLILKGWVGREVDAGSALWWDLPSRVEDELAFRREAVLDTVQSIQTHFLTLYTSREQRCRLGYENSIQCDYFQLGEMIRFFSRIGTLRLQGTILETDDAAQPYAGDITTLLETMRQIPEYQIDRFHTHCGIRTNLMPLLGLLEEYLQRIGICSECWHDDRRNYAWIEQKAPLLWKRQDFHLKFQGHGERHAGGRALFMARQRDWN